MPLEQVQDAYTGRAGEYTALLGSIGVTAAEDQALITGWAQRVRGLILDVGCGPGHWTNFLHTMGAEVIGIDPVDAFIGDARDRYPEVDYQLGRAEHLDVVNASVGGILAWYSLIHTDPDDLDAVLGEFARTLLPSGSLLLGFFEGTQLAPFDHVVTTAYFWPIPDVSRRLAQSGFTVVETYTRTDPGARPHGAIIARRHA